MRIVILFACIVALVFADQEITGKVFQDYLEECANELPKVPILSKLFNPTIVYCAGTKIGFFKDDHPTDKNNISVFCKYLISDPTKAAQCIDASEKCFNKVYGDIGNTSKANILSQKIKLTTCAITHGVITLFDS